MSSLSPKSQNFYTNIGTFTTIGGISGGGAVTAADVTVVVTTADTVATGAAVKSKAIPNYMEFLKVEGWKSGYGSINSLLRHLSRKNRSESSRVTYLRIIDRFCKYWGYEPDSLLKLRKKKIEQMVQDFCDDLLNKNRSRRYVSTVLHILLTFFKVNGFKGSTALNVESYHVPARYRKRKEYIPTKNEVYGMADNAGSLRNRAIILTLYSSGLRVSTLAALIYGDVREELEKGYTIIRIPVYAEMKERVPEACKGNIEYYTFASEYATKAILLYLAERMLQYGKTEDEDPLFASNCRRIEKEMRNQKFMTRREIEYIVKDAARRAGIEDWEQVTPQCLRKAFESILRSELINGGRLVVKDQEYLMGHILPGSQDPYYDKSKIESLRLEFTKLNFGRKIIENRFKTLEITLSKAFADTCVDWREVLKEYASSVLGRS